jgi:hypothetical protein
VIPPAARDALLVRSSDLFRSNFRVIRDAHEVVAEVEYGRFRERARFTLGERAYECRRVGLAGWDFVLRDAEGAELARARRSLLLRSFDVAAGARRLTLRSATWGWTPFHLVHAGQCIGVIERESARGHQARAWLAADMAGPEKVFVIYLAVVAWRRIFGAVLGALKPG